VIEVIGDPIDQIMAQATKVFFAHVAQLRRESGAFSIFHSVLLCLFVAYFALVAQSDSLQDLRNHRSKAIIRGDYSRIPKSFGLPSARD
jgi:hypothetical protein